MNYTGFLRNNKQELLIDIVLKRSSPLPPAGEGLNIPVE
jgi:hypothetical protein